MPRTEPPHRPQKDRSVKEKAPLTSGLPHWKQPRDLPCLSPGLSPAFSAPLQTGPQRLLTAAEDKDGHCSPLRAPHQQHFPISMQLLFPQADDGLNELGPPRPWVRT